ncbi:nucleotide-binding alpha-beta plait domain-containing protein [Tanacetum coccineum]|uniref:Nucleotide-binding alpha-beta plait domain-containing protein n=1 Tax=Tanacetum coccineum TaxID=301880 RepID=A0ABQ5E641_9ASTR
MGMKSSWGECSTTKSRITCDNINGNTTLSEVQGVFLQITSGLRVEKYDGTRLSIITGDHGGVPRFKGVILGIVYHDLYLSRKALVERENAGFDLTNSDLCHSFFEDLTAKGMGLRLANYHTGNHCKDGFTPLETIRRFIGVIRSRSHLSSKGRPLSSKGRPLSWRGGLRLIVEGGRWDIGSLDYELDYELDLSCCCSCCKKDGSMTGVDLYRIPYDTSDPANRFVPNREKTLTLEKEKNQEQLAHANEVRKKTWKDLQSKKLTTMEDNKSHGNIDGGEWVYVQRKQRSKGFKTSNININRDNKVESNGFGRRLSDFDNVMREKATSFYLSNFPDSGDTNALWKMFNHYGKVVDVYIPFKRTKQDARFGFVRFSSIGDTGTFERKLKSITIGSTKLVIN